MKSYLTELERVLFTGKLEITGDKNKHTAGGPRRLTINCRDMVLALLERQTGELRHDILRSHDLLALKCQHRAFLVKVSEPGPIRIER